MPKEKPKTKVIVDIDGALDLCKKRGMDYSKTAVAKAGDTTTMTLLNINKEAPKIVKFLHWFFNETGLTFDEVVKEVKV